MRRKPHPESDGKKVWLSRDEVDLLLDLVDDRDHWLALSLMARCGLRCVEVVGKSPEDELGVAPEHVQNGPGGMRRLRVPSLASKSDRYRETILPSELAGSIETVESYRSEPSSEPIFETTRRTVGRWVDRAAEAAAEETDDEGWHDLSPHDLRRTWGTLLVEDEVEPGLIMDWGGWQDWETFREHYLGAFSPEQERQQMQKVSWL